MIDNLMVLIIRSIYCLPLTLNSRFTAGSQLLIYAEERNAQATPLILPLD
jgi:hypothetical protein